MTPAREGRWAALHAVSLVAAGAWLLYMGRRAWFFYDEWDIVGNPSLGLFQPHNEHWSTLPYLVFRGLYATFGLRTYLPYLAVVVVLHLAAAHVLWRLLRAEGVGGAAATGTTAAFLVFGGGAENLYWAWQVGFVGSVGLGLGAVLLATGAQPSRPRDALAVTCLVLSLMCSGIGVTMLVVAAIALACARGTNSSLRLVAGPALVFATWYGLAGHSGARGYPADPAGWLAFAGEGLSATVELGYDVPLLGALLVIALVLWLLAAGRRPTSRQAQPVAIAGAMGALVLYALLSVGRVRYGPDSATQGRYVYVAAALLVPAAGLALQRLARLGTIGRPAAALLCGVAILLSGRLLVSREASHTTQSVATRRAVSEATALTAAGGFDPAARPDPAGAPNLTLARVDALRRAGALPSR